ncbi:hypothetical protein N7495_008184 [Penicillium taxi]|uniref:uncharacterized protein n=1 Tax=Penicillium taxi TaxID=168475 RepID=UPI0025457294|nr:uncharacterized protein N7495_008184 [Penicillium taxi]KAJ5888143.1 hypothetical protein N7495_008184 [Penicillium taxi]
MCVLTTLFKPQFNLDQLPLRDTIATLVAQNGNVLESQLWASEGPASTHSSPIICIPNYTTHSQFLRAHVHDFWIKQPRESRIHLQAMRSLEWIWSELFTFSRNARAQIQRP